MYIVNFSFFIFYLVQMLGLSKNLSRYTLCYKFCMLIPNKICKQTNIKNMINKYFTISKVNTNFYILNTSLLYAVQILKYT